MVRRTNTLSTSTRRTMSYSAMAELLCHGSTHAFDEALPLFVLHRSQAQRLGRAQRIRGGLGVSPDYGNPTRMHAEESQAERSGQAERG